MQIFSFSFEKYPYICVNKLFYLLTFIINGNNIDVDPQLIFLRELVILNGCEGSQAAFKIDALPMAILQTLVVKTSSKLGFNSFSCKIRLRSA